MGTFLPNQIEGVTELLPMWGLKYGFPARKGVVEVGALSAQSMGVSYQNVSLSLRGNIPVDTMVGIVFLGIDGNYYSAPQQPYKLAFGGHFGGGIATHLGDVVWFRADMKFNVNPGTSLYFGFGFEFQIPSEESKDEAK